MRATPARAAGDFAGRTTARTTLGGFPDDGARHPRAAFALKAPPLLRDGDHHALPGVHARPGTLAATSLGARGVRGAFGPERDGGSVLGAVRVRRDRGNRTAAGWRRMEVEQETHERHLARLVTCARARLCASRAKRRTKRANATPLSSPYPRRRLSRAPRRAPRSLSARGWPPRRAPPRRDASSPTPRARRRRGDGLRRRARGRGGGGRLGARRRRGGARRAIRDAFPIKPKTVSEKRPRRSKKRLCPRRRRARAFSRRRAWRTGDGAFHARPSAHLRAEIWSARVAPVLAGMAAHPDAAVVRAAAEGLYGRRRASRRAPTFCRRVARGGGGGVLRPSRTRIAGRFWRNVQKIRLRNVRNVPSQKTFSKRLGWRVGSPPPPPDAWSPRSRAKRVFFAKTVKS